MTRTTGGVTIKEKIMNNLSADFGYTATIPTRLGTTYNLQYTATGGTLLILQVDEEYPFTG
jgi:hypothetical protein